MFSSLKAYFITGLAVLAVGFVALTVVTPVSADATTLSLVSSVKAFFGMASAPLPITAGGSITMFGTPLTENFDGLAQTGVGTAWTDNVTLLGGYAMLSVYTANDGSLTTAGMQSFGVAGAHPVTDRAWGSIPNNGTGDLYYGFKLTNNTGSPINSLAVTYTGEQWRDDNQLPQALVFEYQVANVGTITDANVPTTGWTPDANLTFVSPVVTNNGAAIDGNAAANRTVISDLIVFTTPVADGQEIWIRWGDNNNFSQDPGLAVDDLSVIANAGTTPTPTATPTATPTGTPTATPTATPICPTLSMPTSSSTAGVDIAVPVSITDTTGLGIISVDFTFTYDPAVLSPVFLPSPPTSVSTTPGTVGPTATVNTNQTSPGVITVSVFDSTNLSGAGVLLYINMHVIGNAGTSTALTLTNVQYNGTLVCSTSSNGTHTVNAAATTTSVSSSINPSVFGSMVTFTATVSSIPAVGNNGTVSFAIDGNPACTAVPVVSGIATCSTSTLDVPGSPHPVAASYSGTVNFSASNGTLSGGQMVTPASTTTVIDCSPGTFVYTGAPITPCTATVTGAGGLSTTATVVYASNTGVGTATANATYTGDPNHTGSTAAQVTFAITVATSSTVINCPVSVIYTGAAQTPCTATVTGAGGLNTTATVIYTNNTNVGTATANATFAGDANHSGSTATQVTFAITLASSSTVINCPVSVIYTGSAQTPCTATVTGAGGLNTTATVVYANNTNVGTATANATFAGDANHTGSTATQVTFAITLASSTTVVNCPVSVVYTGSAQTPCTATVMGAGGLNTTATVIYTNNTNVGTATANATYAGDANHSGSTATQVTFAITAATSSTVINCPVSLVYTGSALTPCTATVTGAGGLNTTATVVYTNNTNVGTATANATYAGDSNHSASIATQVTFAITAASSTTVINCPVSVVYTGVAQTPCTATVTGAGLNTTATVIYTNNTNVGTATANATYAGDANHTGSTATQVTFAITLATSSTVINCPVSVVYTGSVQTPCTATVTGVGGLNTTATVVYANNTNVGTATANATYAGDSNHSGSTATQVTFAITQASSTTVINCPVSVVYTGIAQTPCTATVTGAGLNTTATVIYTNNTNVGTATANATFAGDTNHTGSTATQVTFAITQASSSTVINCPVSVVYTGVAQTPCTATVTGVGGLNTTATVIYTNNTNVGTATANATFAGDANHTGSTATQVTFAITQASSSTVINCPVSVVYTGSVQTPCTATVTGAGGLNTTATVVYTNNTNVGTATANATFAGDANHTGSTATQVTFNITAATSTTVINCPVSVVYNGSARTPCTATVTGAGGLNTTATVIYTNNTNVGTATANATYPGDANHSSSTATQVTFAITAAAPICTVTGYTVQYDALPHTATGQCLGVVGETLAGLNLSGTTHTAIGNYPMDAWSFADVTGNYTNTNGTVADAILSGTITGSVTYAIAPKPVPTVSLNAPGSVPVSGSTNAAGSYLLTGFGAGPYTVTPSKATQLCATSNGVFANDASLVAQHVVGLITLSPTQLLAAKVSGPATPSLSSFDSGLIAQKVVNICNVVNLAGQWRFTPAFVDHPAGVTTDLTENYTAYMLGDVNGDWDPTAAAHRTHFASADSKTAIRGSLPTITVSAGSDIVVPFRIDNLGGRPVSSYQFDVEYDPAVLTASQAAASVTGTMSESLSVVSNSVPGLLKVAVYGALPVSGDGIFVNLRFSVNGTFGAATSLNITDLRINDGTDEVAVIEGRVSVGDVSGNSMVRGRLLTTTGRAVANATVIMSGTNDALYRVVSDVDGRFEFGGLTVGQTYTLSVSSKRFTFEPTVVSVVDSITDLELIASQ